MKSLLPIYVVTLTFLLGIVAGAPVPASPPATGGPVKKGVSSASTPEVPQPTAIYDGGNPNAKEICIRIANGGAGAVGLIKAWADAFIKSEGVNCKIAWYLADTTQSLWFLAEGLVDFALTYNPAAEEQSIKDGHAVKRVPAFTDHFLLAGPRKNPADLQQKDGILTMFNKIVTAGNRGVTRFLSRFDKSATNIKESNLFTVIGQVPWAEPLSKWYHLFPRFPKESLEEAARLDEYILIDLGTWYTMKSVVSKLKAFKIGSDQDEGDLLLNPASLLYAGKRTSKGNDDVCKKFMEWVTSKTGGLKVINEFKGDGEQVLYTPPIPSGIQGRPGAGTRSKL